MSQNNGDPLGFRHFVIGFMVGALFLLMPLLYLGQRCLWYKETDTTLHNRLLAEHYNNQAVSMPPPPAKRAASVDVHILDGPTVRIQTAPTYPPALRRQP